MGVWSKNTAGVFTLLGTSRTALIPTLTQPSAFDWTLELAALGAAHRVFALVYCSPDGRTGHEIGLVGSNIVIRTVLFADPASVTVVQTAAHGLAANEHFSLRVRVADGKIEVRLNGATDPVLTHEPTFHADFKHFGFVSNVDGATVTAAEICDLHARTIDRSDLLHVVCGGDYFEIGNIDFDAQTGTVKLLKAGAFQATGDVCLVQFHTYVLGFDGAHAKECDIVTGSVVNFVPDDGELPGAVDDPDNPGQKLPGSTNVSVATVWRDRLALAWGPDDPQNMLLSKVSDHRSLDTGAEDVGRAIALGTGVARVGQPIVGLFRSPRNSLLITCNNSIWELTGDPVTGQLELSEILNNSGGSGKDAACSLANGSMALHTPNGVYLLRETGNPTPLSSPCLTEGVNLARELTPDYAIQMRSDPARQMVYLYLTPRAGGASTHVAYDERVGGYQIAGPAGLAGGWFPDDFAARFGPTASSPETFLGHVVLGTRDGYLMVPNDEEETDDGTAVTVKLPLSLFRQMKINRETIMRSLLVQPGDGCVVKYRVWGARTAEQLYGYKDGRYLLKSGVANEQKVVDVRKVRAPVMYVELYNDATDSSFEIEEADAAIELGRMLTRKNLVPAEVPGEPCRPPIFPASSLPSSSLTFSSGPGGGTQFTSAEGTSGVYSGSVQSIPASASVSIPLGFSSVSINTATCTIALGPGGDANTLCPSSGPQTVSGGA